MPRAAWRGGMTGSSPTCSFSRSCMKPRESRATAGRADGRADGPLAWLGLAVRLGAAAVWIAAGAAKIPQIHAFQVVVQRYGILPGFLSGPFAYVLPFLELAL